MAGDAVGGGGGHADNVKLAVGVCDDGAGARDRSDAGAGGAGGGDGGHVQTRCAAACVLSTFRFPEEHNRLVLRWCSAWWQDCVLEYRSVVPALSVLCISDLEPAKGKERRK